MKETRCGEPRRVGLHSDGELWQLGSHSKREEDFDCIPGRVGKRLRGVFPTCGGLCLLGGTQQKHSK